MNDFPAGACYAVEFSGDPPGGSAAFPTLDDAIDAVASLLGIGSGPEDAAERAWVRSEIRSSTLWESDAAGPLTYAGRIDGVSFEIRRLACES